MMRFLVNSRLVDGVDGGQLVAWFHEHTIDSATWDLVRHRVVVDHMFKVGDEPGVVLILEVDSRDEAEAIVGALPVVEHGLLRFEIDPVSAVANFSKAPG